MNLCALNAHRFTYHLIDYSSRPHCNAPFEDTCHFLFDCPKYAGQRENMTVELSNLLAPGVHNSLLIPTTINDKIIFCNNLIRGYDSLNYEDNVKLFKIIQTYIVNSNRFQ